MSCRGIFVLFLLGFPLCSLADFRAGALGGLAVTGVSDNPSPNQETSGSTSAQASGKIGVAGIYGVLSGFDVELDALDSTYQTQFTFQGATLPTNVTAHFLELPVFADYTGIPLFRFGLGPVFDVETGAPSVSAPAGNNPLGKPEPQFGRSSIDLAFQVGFRAPPVGRWEFDLNLRYLVGMTNWCSSGNGETDHLHSFDALVGVGFMFR